MGGLTGAASKRARQTQNPVAAPNKSQNTTAVPVKPGAAAGHAFGDVAVTAPPTPAPPSASADTASDTASDTLGLSDKPGPPSPDWLFRPNSNAVKLGSDVQLQNVGPTQFALVPRAIQPYATLEATASGALQSQTDPTQGPTGQIGANLQARFTLNPNTEVGFGGSYGSVFTLDGKPLLSPAQVGSLYGSLHFSEAQPAGADDTNSSGFGAFATGGAAFGAGPAGQTGAFGSGTLAYSWVWPNNVFFKGLDVNAGLAAARYNSINGLTAGNVVQPFLSANTSLPWHLNFEVYGNAPIGTGGNLSDPTSSGTPASFRLGSGLGVQIPFGDYAFGAEIGFTREWANTGVPGGPTSNNSGWLNIGFGAVKRRVDFGDAARFPSEY